jgi:hypothetical protein
VGRVLAALHGKRLGRMAAHAGVAGGKNTSELSATKLSIPVLEKWRTEHVLGKTQANADAENQRQAWIALPLAVAPPAVKFLDPDAGASLGQVMALVFPPQDPEGAPGASWVDVDCSAVRTSCICASLASVRLHGDLRLSIHRHASQDFRKRRLAALWQGSGQTGHEALPTTAPSITVVFPARHADFRRTCAQYIREVFSMPRSIEDAEPSKHALREQARRLVASACRSED